MIIKQKILIEVDSPCISGLTYQYDDCVKMMKKIISEKISGEIYGDDRLKDKSFYWIENPEMIVDVANKERTLYLIVDVHFDDEKYSKEDFLLINNLPWRLSIHGDGDVEEETGIVKNYNLEKVNIEILPEMFYNEKNNDWDVI